MFQQMRDLLKLQAQAKRMQKEMRQISVEAESEGGKIRVEMNGEQIVQKIEIAEDLLRPENKHRLETGLLKTLREAAKAIQRQVAQKGKAMMGGLSGLLK